MCLIVNTKIHGASTNFAPKVAKVPLLVWKSLEKFSIKGHAYSPFMGTKWTFGTPKVATLQVCHEDRTLTIERGLHAHILSLTQRNDRATVNRYVSRPHTLWDIYGDLYPAVIPAGAKFVIGRSGDIVTESLTVYKDVDSMLAKLGVTKLAKGVKHETITNW